MSDSRKYDAGSKSVTNASIATTRVPGSRFRLGPAPAGVAVVGDEPPHAASRLPADPIATAPTAVPPVRAGHVPCPSRACPPAEAARTWGDPSRRLSPDRVIN